MTFGTKTLLMASHSFLSINLLSQNQILFLLLPFIKTIKIKQNKFEEQSAQKYVFLWKLLLMLKRITFSDWVNRNFLCVSDCLCVIFLMLNFCFWFHVRLTATVEPFLPTPPACITLNVSDSAQTPPTIVIIVIEFQSSKLPNTLKLVGNVWFLGCFFLWFWIWIKFWDFPFFAWNSTFQGKLSI